MQSPNLSKNIDIARGPAEEDKKTNSSRDRRIDENSEGDLARTIYIVWKQT